MRRVFISLGVMLFLSALAITAYAEANPQITSASEMTDPLAMPDALLQELLDDGYTVDDITQAYLLSVSYKSSVRAILELKKPDLDWGVYRKKLKQYVDLRREMQGKEESLQEKRKVTAEIQARINAAKEGVLIDGYGADPARIAPYKRLKLEYEHILGLMIFVDMGYFEENELLGQVSQDKNSKNRIILVIYKLDVAAGLVKEASK